MSPHEKGPAGSLPPAGPNLSHLQNCTIMTAYRQLQFAFPGEPTPAFTATDQETLDLLKRVAGVHTEVWHSTKRLAAMAGVGVRAMQVRINRLIDVHGLVDRVLDYGLRTRRKIVLLFRSVPAFCAHAGPDFAPTASVPPDPPIEVPEGASKNVDDVLTETAEPREPEPAGLSSSSSPSDPRSLGAADGPKPVGQALGRVAGGERSSSSPDEPQRKATKAEFESVVEKARKAFPHVPCVDWKVRALAKRRRVDGVCVGLRWVDQALDWAVHRNAVRWRFMESLIADWCENGPSGPPVARKAVQQNYNPRVDSPPDETPLTPEDVEKAREWASGRCGSALVWVGRKMLARIGLDPGVPS